MTRMDSTEVALREHIEARLAALHRELELRMTASDIAVGKAHAVLERQLDNIEKRDYATREELLSLRDSLTGQAQAFALRHDVENLRASHEEQLRGLGRQVYLIAGGLAVLQIVAQIFLVSR